MKINSNKLNFLLILFLICTISCSETETISIQEELSPSLLELDINRIEIDAANLDNPALTLSWSESTYSIQTPVRYRVELSADQSFSDILIAGVVSTNSITWSMAQLNSSASDVGLAPFEWATMYARVVSFIGTQSALETISNAVAF